MWRRRIARNHLRFERLHSDKSNIRCLLEFGYPPPYACQQPSSRLLKNEFWGMKAA